MDEIKAVAVVGPVYGIDWVGTGPVAPIIQEHGIKVGDYLYPQQAIDTLRAELEGLTALHAQYVLFLEDEKARAERVEAEAEADALRKDAERYRWLRDTQTTFGISGQYDDAGSAVLFLRFHGYGSIRDDVDAAIDEAKQAAE